MKSLRFVALSALLTVSTFFAVLYSSCTKDACKGVTCLNTGTCTGGVCTCPSGIGGFSCETVYRENYKNTYGGNGAASAGADTLSYANSKLTFSDLDSTLPKMTLSIQVPGATIAPNLTIDLANNSASGSTFTVEAAADDSFSYAGSGAVSATVASLNLVKTKTSTGKSITYTFSSLTKQ